jgi:hypothetical protein
MLAGAYDIAPARPVSGRGPGPIQAGSERRVGSLIVVTELTVSALTVCRMNTSRIAHGIGAILLGASAVLFAATPASASPAGLVMVSATSADNSTDFKSVSATCPAGKKVLGGGAQTFGWYTGYHVLVTQAYPDGVNNRFTVGAWEDEARTPETWTVTAYAICANPLAGLEYISTPWYDNISGTWAVCSSGKKLVGMGGHIINSSGEVALVGIFPNSGLSASETWVSEDHTGYAPTYSVKSYAVCANPIAGQQYITKSFSDTLGVGISVPCPAGKKVLSSGVRLNSGGGTLSQGEGKFSLAAPNSALTSTYVSAEEYDNSNTAFNVQVVGLCA